MIDVKNDGVLSQREIQTMVMMINAKQLRYAEKKVTNDEDGDDEE